MTSEQPPAADGQPRTTGTAAPLAFDGSEDPLLHELRTLVLSRNAGISVETEDEERADALIAQAARDLELPLLEWSIAQGMRYVNSANYMPDSQQPLKALQAIDAFSGDAIFVLKDFTKHLTDPTLTRRLYEALELFSRPPRLSTAILLDTQIELPAELEPLVTAFDIKLPKQHEYEAAIRSVIEGLLMNQRARIEIRADQVPQLADALRGLTLNQARRAVAQVAVDDGRLNLEDISQLVDLKAEMLERGGLLEFKPASALDAQLGGFENLAKWLERTKLAFSSEARELNLPTPKGVMFVGVQGCGKSLAAKAIARSWQLPLLRLDVGRLYDKFVGQSEKNFRDAITVAESLAPAVLWIDEIEKALSTGAPGGEADSGLSQRLMGTFLTWLQEKQESVFVVATANDLSALPPELLRKGRFDEIFFVDLPDTAERAEIFRIHLTLRRQDPARFDLSALAAATVGFSGAEIEHVVVTALLDALQQQRRTDTEAIVQIAAATIPLSHSRSEDIERLRAVARDRFTPVR